jgi:hypothetical protein
MTNIAFKDIAGGPVRVYTANKDLPRVQRLKLALQELQQMTEIKIYLRKGKKLRLINVKRF